MTRPPALPPCLLLASSRRNKFSSGSCCRCCLATPAVGGSVAISYKIQPKFGGEYCNLKKTLSRLGDVDEEEEGGPQTYK